MMMMGDKKKKMATIIVGNMKKGGSNSKEVDMNTPEMDADAGHLAGADELISAIHAKDGAGVHRALSSLHKMYSMADDFQAQDAAGNEANRTNYND